MKIITAQQRIDLIQARKVFIPWHLRKVIVQFLIPDRFRWYGAMTTEDVDVLDCIEVNLAENTYRRSDLDLRRVLQMHASHGGVPRRKQFDEAIPAGTTVETIIGSLIDQGFSPAKGA